ncbi:hypothetical protein [Thiomonas sp. 13-64-67]|uniref:hypothetical protein n=1 Tax=Thiomonas sp. 13-64-67 TaxID=1970447 RepID=UPI00257B8143|nr:hypothetical protein [Thiomonas sp. 13-64-67]
MTAATAALHAAATESRRTEGSRFAAEPCSEARATWPFLLAFVIGIGILVGSNASWYFAWIFGTAFFVLLLAGAVVWFERLDEPRTAEPHQPN